MGEIMTKIKTDFDSIEEQGTDLDIPYGDNEQVLGLAAFQNMGKAIVDDDLYPEGNYLLHSIPNMMEVRVIKESKTSYHFVINVYNHVLEAYNKELDIKKKMFESNPESNEHIIYDAPIWIIWDLALNQQVHPFIDESEFEKVLYAQYPDLWINKAKAPKRIIT